MHRVQQILNAAGAVLSANPSLGIVEINRVRSLSEEHQELPALTVNYGADVPDDSESHESLGSAVEILLSAFCVGDNETEVLERLLEMRSQSHTALMADMSLGLPFLWEIKYGGADAPVLQQAERMLGAQTSRWSARYLMDNDDPQ